MSLVNSDSMTSISDFKAACETLGRFADVRETAKEPRDRVLIQLSGGKLKLVGGDEDMSVVVDLGEQQGKAKAVVSSRLLLNAAKALRGRGDLTVEVGPSGAVLRHEGGGSVKLSPISSVVPSFVRPPKKAEAVATVSHPGLDTAAKVFPAVTSKHYPSSLVYLRGGQDNLTMAGTDQRSYARWDLLPEVTVSRLPLGAVPATLFPQMRDLTEPGVIAWGDGRLAIRSGRFLVGARIAPEETAQKSPVHGSGVRVVANRKQLIDSLRAASGADSNHRVRLEVGTAGSLSLANWEGAGSLLLPAQTEGRGHVGVNADRMRKLLTALPGKSAVVEFAGPPPGNIALYSEEAEGWYTLLAPVV